MAPLFEHFYAEGVIALRYPRLGCWRYNIRNLEFLQEQMNKLNSCQGSSEVLKTAQDSGEGSARSACYKRLSHAMSLWERVIHHHTQSFQLEKFYTATEVQAVVETICKSLIAFVEEFSLGVLGIEDRVPPKDVDDDRKTLQERLGYILGLWDCCFDDLPEEVGQEWVRARTAHKQELDTLVKSRRLINDEEIYVSQCICDAVSVCTWRGRELVVKNVVTSDGGHQDLVGLARFYAATRAPFITALGVVHICGVTRSGKVVMEKGAADMLTWFLGHRSGGVQLKLQLLQQAAMALADVHREGLVHCDVRPPKFIVFKSNPLEVKISAFHCSTDSSDDAVIVVAEAGAVERGAPEMLYGAPHSFLSDIYNFGVVANMLISEVQPGGRGCSDAKVSQGKADWQTPWKLPQDCPEGLANLILECCSLDPAARPLSMEDVSDRLAMLLQCSAVSGDAAMQTPATLEEPLHELASAKYNKKMMCFLSQQLERVHNLKAPTEASKDSVLAFEKALETGRRLIHKHEERVDVKTFYQSIEARDIVEHVCDSLFVVAREWELEDTLNVDTKVPGTAFSADREALAKLLNFVLKGEHVDSVGAADIPQGWLDSRNEHVDRMQGLPKVGDEEIDRIVHMGEGAVSIVHACNYKRKRVAMKDFVRKGGAADIENMAELFKDVLIQMSLRDGPVAKLLAITKSGRLLMELADMDLKAFCRKFRLKWPQQLRILLQAAGGLRYMHSRDPPIVHCDVKSPNFLVFGSDIATCTVKITDFGLACEATAARRKTARRPQGTCLWVAPELFEGALLSLTSDVYSFGLVMYEVITGKELYGLQSLSQPGNNLLLMKKKVAGEEPCAVQASECPKEMHELMKECCHLDPTKRPTMAQVCRRLSELQELQTDDVLDRTSMHRTLWGSVIKRFSSFKAHIVWCLAAIFVFSILRDVHWIGNTNNLSHCHQQQLAAPIRPKVVEDICEAPFIVNVLDILEIHMCVGVLISQSVVLIPASCARPNLRVVRTISSDLVGGGPAEEKEDLIVCRKIVHSDFTGHAEGSNNIALLILCRNASTPVNRIPGLLPLGDCPQGQTQTFGWFAPTLNSGPSEKLKVVRVNPVKREDCEKLLPKMSSGSMCFEPGWFQGMIWSPGAVLMCNSTGVIGMMTHTLPNSRPYTRLPYVFTSAWEHRDWIKSLGGGQSIFSDNNDDPEWQSVLTKGDCAGPDQGSADDDITMTIT